MTAIRWRASPALDRSVIYTVPSQTSTDDAPLSDPLGNLARVKWCSDFNYVGVVANGTHTGTVSLGAKSAGSPFADTHTLFAHAQSGGIPGVFGVLPNLLGSGVDVPLLGSIVIETDTLAGGLRVLNLYADATNVYLVDFGLSRQAPAGFASHSIDWRVYVSDKVF